jgi:hypothetical protein
MATLLADLPGVPVRLEPPIGRRVGKPFRRESRPPDGPGSAANRALREGLRSSGATGRQALARPPSPLQPLSTSENPLIKRAVKRYKCAARRVVEIDRIGYTARIEALADEIVLHLLKRGRDLEFVSNA